MSDPKILEEKVVTPTEEEQEAVTGGMVGNTQAGRNPLEVDPKRIDRPIPAPWRPGPPPETF